MKFMQRISFEILTQGVGDITQKLYHGIFLLVFCNDGIMSQYYKNERIPLKLNYYYYSASFHPPKYMTLSEEWNTRPF